MKTVTKRGWNMGEYHEQIKNAVIERMSYIKHPHQRDIKSVIDDIKNQYLLESKIKLEDLKKVTAYWKEHWQELKELARRFKNTGSIAGFASFQV